MTASCARAREGFMSMLMNLSWAQVLMKTSRACSWRFHEAINSLVQSGSDLSQMVFWRDILAIFGYIFKIFPVAKILTYRFMNRTFSPNKLKVKESFWTFLLFSEPKIKSFNISTTIEIWDLTFLNPKHLKNFKWIYSRTQHFKWTSEYQNIKIFEHISSLYKNGILLKFWESPMYVTK